MSGSEHHPERKLEAQGSIWPGGAKAKLGDGRLLPTSHSTHLTGGTRGEAVSDPVVLSKEEALEDAERSKWDKLRRDRAAEQIAEDIERLGYVRLIFKSDNEPALLVLKGMVADILNWAATDANFTYNLFAIPGPVLVIQRCSACFFVLKICIHLRRTRHR